MREHGDAVEADLLRFYGVDLLDLWRGGLSVRRLQVLVKGLPTDSALWAALNGTPYGWTPSEFLIADVFHALAGEPHPSRPSDTSSKSSADEKVAALLAQRERLQAARSPEENPA